MGGEEREGNIGEGDLLRIVVENAAWDLKTYSIPRSELWQRNASPLIFYQQLYLLRSIGI